MAVVEWRDLRGELREVLQRFASSETTSEAVLTAAVQEIEATLRGRVEMLAEQEIADKKAELDEALEMLAGEQGKVEQRIQHEVQAQMLQHAYEASVGHSVLVLAQALGNAMAAGQLASLPHHPLEGEDVPLPSPMGDASWEALASLSQKGQTQVASR